MAVLRSRRGALLSKVESTEGTDAAPSTTDAILVENPRITFDPSLVTTQELTGSLDPREPIVGGLKVAIAFDVYLKGSGAGATAPEFGSLFKACGWEEVVTAVAIGPEAVTTGSTTQATLSAAATSAAQAYRGMPIELTDVVPLFSFITNYTSGKVATLANSFAPAINSTSTDWTIPANVLYRPTSDASLIKTLTHYLFMDGVRYKILGSRGSFSLTMVAGQPGRFSFNFTGMYGGKADVAVPAIAAFDSTRPPIWRDPNADTSGQFTIDRTEAALRQLTFDNGANLVYPDNPNALEGFDPSVIVGRRMTGRMDPLATLIATRDLMADFRAGTQRLVHARVGTAAGNRFGLVVPAAHPESYAPGDREGLMTEDVGFFCSGDDAGAFMAFW